MRLVVVEPDRQAAESLCRQVERLEHEAVAAHELQLARDLCAHTHPELMICTDPGWAEALAEAHRRTPVVLATRQPPTPELLLRVIRAGLADVWELPITDALLAERISSVVEQRRAAQAQSEAQLREHVNELQRDQRAGRYIQMGMLPPNPMAIDRYRLQHRIVPSLILSGDFVDYFRITDRYFAFYVADVSGHGASSAFVTVLLKNFSRRLRREYRPSMIREPGEILEWINRELLEQRIDKHAVMILAIGDLERNTATLVNAGHFPPAIHVRGKTATFVEQRGKPVGLFETVHYESRAVGLEVGDRLVVFSDGVLDALGKMELCRKEEMLLKAAREPDMESIWRALDLRDKAAPDDMTCLIVARER